MAKKMSFGDKIRDLRIEKGISQTQLGEMVGASLRTVRGWEVEGRFPKKSETYTKLSDVLGCNVSYLMNDNEAFIAKATVDFGNRGAAQANNILDQTAVLFAGGELSEDDQIEFLQKIQKLYLDSKERAKKFTPKKYRK
ncbi:MAG TPA: helix-turn-helix transcriptional regulator [Lachnospiraceae bacterium]|nr:helix-turn-helix transcriptional regulator [Lachnospiraceae bacterium]